jgi:hypothetical protein
MPSKDRNLRISDRWVLVFLGDLYKTMQSRGSQYNSFHGAGKININDADPC